MELAQRLAERLRRLREEAGLSQVQMAKRLGLSQSTLNRLEAADQNTTLRTLDRLCRALRAEHERGPAWRFVGIEVDWVALEALHAARHLSPAVPTVAWRTSAPIYRDGEQVGYATSGCCSPMLKKYLALAHLRAPHFETGSEVEMEITVEHERRKARAQVAKLPFFDPARKKQ